MKLKINDVISVLENDSDSIAKIFTEVNKVTNSSELIFSHLIIDGVEVFDDYETYIAEGIEGIQTIEAILITNKEFTDQLLISANTYLEGALPEIGLLSDEFYQGANPETWNKFHQLIEGVQWIVQMFNTIDQYLREDQTFELMSMSTSLIEVLQTLEDALKLSDNVLIGDIINYEIKPILESINTKITTIIDNEVTRHDLN